MAPINRPIQAKVDEMQSFENGKSSGQKTNQPISVTPAVGFQERSFSPARAALAAPVYVNKTHPTDFPWNIQWNAETCIRCGACVAACTFGAIEPQLIRQGQTISMGNFPTPVTNHHVVIAIRQVVDSKMACRGCTMCERVCPTNSIQPVLNAQHRFPLVARRGGTPVKRGGRAHHIPVRALDYIKVGRISQMTDPALDAARHTFDMLTPLGRNLPARELPLKVENGKLVMQGQTPPMQWIYPVMIGDMSIGALSWRMWEALALAVAYLNEQCGMPVRMNSGEGGMPMRRERRRLFAGVGDAHSRTLPGAPLRHRQPGFAEAEDENKFAVQAHRIFIVESPNSTSMMVMIQKRTTTCVSFQPESSKWWWRGAMRKMRLPPDHLK